MPKKRKRSLLIKDLDRVFSLYVRYLFMDANGDVECYTCNRSYPVKKMQCGHFQSRKHYSTRWHINNARPQCYGCNVMQQGQQYLFGLYLNDEQEGLAEEMLQLSRQTVKLADFEIIQLTEDWRQRLWTLCKEKKVSYPNIPKPK